MCNNISLLNLRVVEDLVFIGWEFKRERCIAWKHEFKCKPRKNSAKLCQMCFGKQMENYPSLGKLAKETGQIVKKSLLSVLWRRTHSNFWVSLLSDWKLGSLILIANLCFGLLWPWIWWSSQTFPFISSNFLLILYSLKFTMPCKITAADTIDLNLIFIHSSRQWTV